MAACSSLEHLFEKPLPESPTLLDSLSPWNHIKSLNGDSPFAAATNIFGELHFEEAKNTSNAHHVPSKSSPSPPPSPCSSSSSSNSRFWADVISLPQLGIGSSNTGYQIKEYRHSSNSFSSMNSDSLSLCTEGLGFESSDDIEDQLNNKICSSKWQQQEERRSSTRNPHNEPKRSTVHREALPPPISCIGRNGKPWVCFKSYRQDGRFILKEIRIPIQEFLHASREDGRLKLQFIHSDEDEDDHEEDVEEENRDSSSNDDAGQDRKNNLETPYR